MSRLHDFQLFSGIRHETIDQLTHEFPTKTYKKDEYLTKQGSKNHLVHLILEGRVRVESEAKDGKRTTIIFHEAPYIVGHIEIWKESPNLANVIAMEKCQAIVLTKKDYLKLLQTNHQVSINMVKVLSNLIYQTGRDQHVRLFGQVDHLIANTLCSFAQLYGEEKDYGILVRKPISKSELAEILGVARRSVIRGLKELEKDGLIQMDGKDLVIPDIAELQRRAHAVIL